jgi:nitroimidazol reductase NimA-like FMN-containing flavoprotein (pyridoxamine 5'-phosphate oxidase superfamily)
MAEPPSPRTTVRRGAHRAVYDRAEVHRILDAGLLAHVAVATDDGPLVLPMAYGHDGRELYLHGAVGNGLLRAGIGREVCATVTIVDGLVIARSPFHDSMDHRSVVVRGRAREVVDGEAKVSALRRIVDHVVPHWDTGRAPTPAELRRTLVLALPLDEVSAKVRTGGPGDEPTDVAGPHWGGWVPLVARWGAPIDSADLTAGIAPPSAVAELEGRVAMAAPAGQVQEVAG